MMKTFPIPLPSLSKVKVLFVLMNAHSRVQIFWNISLLNFVFERFMSKGISLQLRIRIRNRFDRPVDEIKTV